MEGGLKFFLRVHAACGGGRAGEFLAGLRELFGGAAAEALQLGEFSLVEATVWVLGEAVNDFADGIVEDYFDLLDAASLGGAARGLGEN